MLGLIALVPLLAAAVVYGSGHAMTQWSSRAWPGTEMIITSVDQSSNRVFKYTYEFRVDGVKYTAQGRTTKTVVTPNQIKALRSKYAVGTRHDGFLIQVTQRLTVCSSREGILPCKLSWLC